jgi:ribokinase
MIVTFGSVNLDFVVSLPRLPTAGETISGPDYQTFPGGKGANQALAARRAGANVKMIGAVGQDVFADLALANLIEAGVDLTGVRRLEGTTGLAFIGVDLRGENQIMVASGANKKVEAEWLSGTLGSGEILLMQGEVPDRETGPAIELARKAGARIVWNPAPVPPAPVGRLAADVDVLIVNEGEAAGLSEQLNVPGDPSGFLDAMATGNRFVVVTLGSEGVLAASAGAHVRIKPPMVDVRDTTGAGDAFCGALAAALDRGAAADRALREATAAGALACTATGAQTSAPSLAEISSLAETIKPV